MAVFQLPYAALARQSVPLRKPSTTLVNCVCACGEVQSCAGPSYVYAMCNRSREISQKLGNSLLFKLFQVAFGILIAFSTSLEGSVIEMKHTILDLQVTVVSLKA